MSNKENGIPFEGLPGRAAREGESSVNVGHGNFILASRIVAVLASGSLPTKRLRERATEDNLLLDATAGRKTRSLVVTDSRHVVLSSLAPQKLQERLCPRATRTDAQREMEDGEFAS